MNLIFQKIFKNKKVIITGHTGFKGSWLTMWLTMLGAKVIGFSDNFISSPSHFQLLRLNKKIIHKKLDIRDLVKLKKLIKKYQPMLSMHYKGLCRPIYHFHYNLY